ncbi:alpha/beta fold hydrolase [Candidatus Saccharibacteria bacterium]|nr:alpha/beta fold hydrolase [Candidatus Saccharibacteria bacterium]
MSTVFGVVKVIAIVIVLLIVLSFVVDAALRLRMDTDVSVSTERGSADNGTLIVYLPGILAGGRASSVGFIDIWRRNSDLVLLVEYGDERFDGEFCAKVVADAIQRQNAVTPFRRIVFIGSSMGGLLAYDVIRQLDVNTGSLEDTVSIELIALDAPTSRTDFQPPNHLVAPVLRVLPFGPIWNRLNLIEKMFVPPKEENIEVGVDRAELARRVDEGKNYRISFWRDELVYIMTHGAPKYNALEGRVDRLVYVRSTRDNDTVRPEAYNAWAATTSVATRMEVDSTHVGFAERPKTWRQAFEKLLG